MKPLFLITFVLFVAGCSSPSPTSPQPSATPTAAAGSGFQQIINVSSYDPKARTRSGRSYSEYDVRALRDNGARGLIARAGKGGNLDKKCSAFVAAADKAGMLPGLYYRVQKHRSPESQADQFVNRAISLARSRSWRAPSMLLCGDYDGDLTLAQILRFQDRVEQRTGIVPVSYLENSPELKLQTRRASREVRARMTRAPYWLALYSNTSGDGPIFKAPGSPRNLVKQYRMWGDWTLWQYGGVDWANDAPRAKVYNHGNYRFSQYFGNLDRPVERNVFRGTPEQLTAFWARHGLKLQ